GVLNPVYTVLYQVMEPMIEHGVESRETARDKAIRLLAHFGLPEHRMDAYPHELSSGEQQRVLTAMALANDPEFVILDEPLSSLDAGSRFELGTLLKETAKVRTSLIFTHDLDTAAKLSDRTAMLYGGRIVEAGTTREVLLRPRHPYTRALIRAYPNMSTAKDLQGIKGSVARGVTGCPFHPRCTQAVDLCRRAVPELRMWSDRHVACHRGGVITLLRAAKVTKAFDSRRVVDSVDLEVDSGETVALVGQSGSGKTTLAKTIMGLCRADEGEVFLEGQPVGERTKDFYKRVQMVFQNPGESLSHRLSVLEAVREPLDIQGEGTREQREAKALRVLGEVELPQSHEFVSKYPHHLSGGELQRVAIARALVLDPELLIADEPTTFLDASVQAKVLKLLLKLQEEHGLSMLFITHDIAVARKVSDRMAIMLDGRVVEVGATSEVVEVPRHEYTESLLRAAPALDLRYPVTGRDAFSGVGVAREPRDPPTS
ncbi:MAG: ABC transporter ATP-binding protein, partial [Chloroflexota bacterium]